MNKKSEAPTHRSMTFEQREGVSPLPSQLQPGELSQEARALLWYALYSELGDLPRDEFRGDWHTILTRKHVRRDHLPVDEFARRPPLLIIEDLKTTILKGTYSDALGLIEWILRQPECPSEVQELVDRALKEGRTAYTLLDGDTIMPAGSEYEAITIVDAVDVLSASGFPGAEAHLKNAAQLLTDGKWADSVRESIHAVESVVRVLEPSASTLGPALKKIAAKNSVHAALEQGFQKLYGYTSDHNGIRHPLLDKAEAEVDEADAMYMIGSCSAFVSYLIRKGK
jgi:hypothetical protein